MSEQTATPNNDFAIGDKVTWTHMRVTGHAISLTERQGTVVQINNGGILQVKARNGRLNWVYPKTDGVRKHGQRNAITEALLGPESSDKVEEALSDLGAECTEATFSAEPSTGA